MHLPVVIAFFVPFGPIWKERGWCSLQPAGRNLRPLHHLSQLHLLVKRSCFRACACLQSLRGHSLIRLLLVKFLSLVPFSSKQKTIDAKHRTPGRTWPDLQSLIPVNGIDISKADIKCQFFFNQNKLRHTKKNSCATASLPSTTSCTPSTCDSEPAPAPPFITSGHHRLVPHHSHPLTPQSNPHTLLLLKPRVSGGHRPTPPANKTRQVAA
ncbi:hypothetical protein V8F06_005571 [Rhypophila decipiens]